MEEGARIVLRTSAALRSGERVLIVADSGSRVLGEAFAAAARDLGADPVVALVAARTSDGEEPPEPVGTAMQASDVILLVTSRSLTHTHARRAATRAGARVLSMPGITEEMLRAGALATDWNVIHESVRRVARRLRGSREVRLTSPAGTDVRFEVAGRDWVAEDTGLCSRKGSFTTLPAGELFIAPVEGTAEGRLVLDVYFDEPLLEQASAILTAGYATKILGAERAIHAMNRGGRDGRAFARFGFGLNPRARVTGPHLEAEKALGTAHVGFGDNLVIGGKIHCGVKVEAILAEANVSVDGKALIERGRLVE
jgi:leucyl aminopeptidase (aminopeptidase T)